MHSHDRARLANDRPDGKGREQRQKQKSAEIAPSAFCSVQDLQHDHDARKQQVNICLDADGLSRAFLQELRRLWTAPQHPLRAACSAPSKTVSGLHGSIGLPSRLQPLQVAPVRPREVVLAWARANQSLNPWYAWPHAMVAKHSRDPKERQRAIAMTQYLDVKSERLSGIDKKEIEAATRDFAAMNPFLRPGRSKNGTI